jgi:hypothetical protein
MKALRKEEEIGEKKEYLAGSMNLNVLVQKNKEIRLISPIMK